MWSRSIWHSFKVYQVLKLSLLPHPPPKVKGEQLHIITSISVSPIGGAVTRVVMYVKTFKTGDIVFKGNVIIMCLTSHWPLIFKITVSSLILTISPGEIKEKMSISPGEIKEKMSISPSEIKGKNVQLIYI